MDYQLVDLSRRDVSGLVPGRVARLLYMNNVYSFAAMDREQNIKGLAVFRNPADTPTRCILEYLNVDEDVTDASCRQTLLLESEKFLKKHGIRTIYTKHIGKVPELGETYDFLTSCKYLPVTYNGHFLVYYLEDLADCLFAQKLDALVPLMRNVKFRRELSKAALNNFLDKTADLGLDVDPKKIDLLFARFYVQKDEVIGFLDLQEIEEHILLFSGMYLDEKADKYTPQAMIASALRIAFAVLPPETIVVLQVINNEVYNGLKRLFGESERDDKLMELIKEL